MNLSVSEGSVNLKLSNWLIIQLLSRSSDQQYFQVNLAGRRKSVSDTMSNLRKFVNFVDPRWDLDEISLTFVPLVERQCVFQVLINVKSYGYRIFESSITYARDSFSFSALWVGGGINHLIRVITQINFIFCVRILIMVYTNQIEPFWDHLYLKPVTRKFSYQSHWDLN